MTTEATFTRLPRTKAVRRALQAAHEPKAAADLLFLEAWEMNAPDDLGVTLRAGQIRRANPVLVAEIEAELEARR
jgi:hypothetical protein